MTAALMLTMAACAGNSTADTGVESSASSAVSSKPVSNTSSTAASSAKPSASAKPTATPSAGAAATVKPTATPKPAATAKPSSSNTSNSKPSGSTARPTAAPTAKPTAAPTAAPTAKPTAKPMAAPTAVPTAVPTATPKPKEKVWVVDTPAREEVGHWEEDYWMGSDWVYQCNACGTQFSTVDEFESHSDYEWELGNDHGSYTMTSGEMYKHYTGEKYWVVDIPAQDEVGHWEYR